MSIGDKVKGFFVNHGQKLLNITTGVSGIYCIEQLCEGKYMNATCAGMITIIAPWINTLIYFGKKQKQLFETKIETNENNVAEIRQIRKNIHSIFQDLFYELDTKKFKKCMARQWENQDNKINYYLNLPKKTSELRDLSEILGNSPKDYGI